MEKELIISIDPSEIGSKTSGTGIAYCIANHNGDKEFIIMDVHLLTVLGKKFKNQAEYNNFIVSALDLICESNKVTFKKLNITIRIESFKNYNLGATQFKENKTSEMIGVIESWALNNKYNLVKRDAKTIKSRWNKEVLIHDEWLLKIGKETHYASEFRIDNKKYISCAWTKFDDKTKHSYDAFRHLVDELVFGKWKEKYYATNR